MSTISLRQNAPANLRLLAAQRQMYSQAKLLHNLYAGSGLSLEFAAPVIILLKPEARVALDTIGVMALLLSLWLKALVAAIVKRAATVQEQFDVNVFDLPWNRTLVGMAVSPELINAADRAFKGDRRKLENWYGEPSGLQRPLDVLVCQRSGLVWDRRLRQSYALLFNAVTVGYLLISIVIGGIAGRMLLEYIGALLIPSMPALLEGFSIVKEHRKVAAEEERVSQDILDLWERGLADPAATTLEECRRLQDSNYIKRSNAPLVPDRWYWLFRERYEADMRAAIADLKAKAKRKRTGGAVS